MASSAPKATAREGRSSRTDTRIPIIEPIATTGINPVTAIPTVAPVRSTPRIVPLESTGGEGGIRTHGPFGQRFSRPSQSTALPPLRRSSYGRVPGSADPGRIRDRFRRRIAEAGREGEGEEERCEQHRRR